MLALKRWRALGERPGAQCPLVITNQLKLSNAFIAAWLPGTEDQGMIDLLFGDYNFTGKLPVTWPNDVNQEPINDGGGKPRLFPEG